MYVYVVYLT